MTAKNITQTKGVPAASEQNKKGLRSDNRFANMDVGNTKGQPRKDEPSKASQKFDALFGAPQAQPEQPKEKVDLEEILQGSLAPADKGPAAKGPRKVSDKGANRKQSSLPEPRVSGPRRKFDKAVLLQRFKLT